MPVSRDRIRRELKILQLAGNGTGLTPAASGTDDELSKSVHGTSSTTGSTGMTPNIKKEMRSFHQYSAETELELLNAVASLEAEKSALSNKLAELTVQRDEVQDQLNDLRNEVEVLHQDRAVNVQKREETISALELADQEVERLKAELKSRLDASSDVSSQQRMEIERLEAALADVTSKLEAKDMEAASALKLADQKFERLIADMKSRDDAASDISSQEIMEIERLEADIANTNEALQAKDREIDDLKSMLQLSAEEVGRLAVQSVAMKEESDKLIAEVEQLRNEKQVDEGRIEDLKARDTASRNERGSEVAAETTGSYISEETSKLRQQIAHLEEQLRESDARNETLAHEIQVVTSVLASTEQQNDNLEGELTHLKGQRTKSDRAIEGRIQQEVACAMKNRDDNIEELRRQLEDANVRKGELDIELFNMQNTVTKLQKEKDDTAAELEHHLEEIVTGNTQLLARLQAKEDEVAAVRSHMAALRQEMNSYVATKRQEIEDCEAELMQKSHIIAEKERTIQSLRDLSNDYLKNTNAVTVVSEDYTESPRTVRDPVAISPERSFNGMNKVENEHTIDHLRAENSELLDEVSALSSELQKLREDNRQLRVSDVHGTPNAANKILRKRNEQLKKDVEKATRRLKAMDKMMHASRID
mmetsp:Transcript_11374/g.23240  ORF Transcript_11374/g.23240 Transcript_11374/m.23240 type:complete len:652 (+) Transcript_11374:168-2123(+)|eukprot:CAMPEP_0178725006 /NCGR_PEP_ID=MMETSP0699-20121125/26419_1 /TAXON_ID=265572 /ORGANISM="Extubocellulus spinifer, Strain CCMP396" /LENGTH=651 /DNA_ID=CAMNT_0020376263 /DNA_START=155 /DNA_END=2110 /DNA_ORIENTATION=-